MLQLLHIENIAVIERADIELEDGLTVLSGETGAGKSIVIDSIGALLGRRVSRDLVRAGLPTCRMGWLRCLRSWRSPATSRIRCTSSGRSRRTARAPAGSI